MGEENARAGGATLHFEGLPCGVVAGWDGYAAPRMVALYGSAPADGGGCRYCCTSGDECAGGDSRCEEGSE